MTSNAAPGGRLTEGPVRRHVWSLTLPMTIGILAMVTKNLVDTYFVAQLGTSALSAISFTFPIVMLMMSVTIGLGAGASSVVSRVIGQGDPAQVQRHSTDAIVLAILVMGAVCLAGLGFIRPLFFALGARGEVLDLVVDYMKPWFLGLMFLVIPMVGNSLCRAAGDARLPGLIMVGSAGLNALFDPFLIFGWWGAPELGIAGASTATVCSNVFATMGSLALLHYKERMLTFRPPQVQDVILSWRPMLAIGLPAAAANMVNPLGVAFLTALLARISDSAVAGYGVASRLEGLSLIALLALSSAIGPIVGQNLGARRMDRVDEAMRTSFRICIQVGTVTAALLAVLGPLVVPTFDDATAVQSTAILYLWMVPITFSGYGINIVQAAAFNAIGKPTLAAALTVSRMFLVILPVAWVLVSITGSPMAVFAGTVVGNIVGGTLGWLGSRRMMRQFKSTAEPPRDVAAVGV